MAVAANLKAVIEKLAFTDPEWVVDVSILGGVSESVIQLWLAKGLESTRHLLDADVDARRKFSIYEPRGPRVQPGFLSEGLRGATDPNINECLEEMSPEEKSQAIKPPFYGEADSGPKDVWRWSHH